MSQMNSEIAPKKYYDRPPRHDTWPMGITDPDLARSVYEMGIAMFLESEFFPEKALFTLISQGLYQKFASQMREEKRWQSYQAPEIGDSNVAHHTLRQVAITLQSLYFDAQYLGLSYEEIDIMGAAAYLHDFGEAVGKDKVGDITQDLKNANRKELERQEALAFFKVLNEENLDSGTRERLKIIYIKVTTSLSLEDVGLVDNTTTEVEGIRWEILKKQFTLYEMYGYLITAFQQFPARELVAGVQDEDMKKLREWNRPELEEALKTSDEEVPTFIRQFVLFTNVYNNHIGDLRKIQKKGMPSANIIFNDRYVLHVLELYQTIVNAA